MSENLPNGWKRVKLGEVCIDISYGYTASAKLNPKGVKFLRITDIVSDRIDWENVPYCEIPKTEIEKYKLEIGDIVIARTGATTGYNKIIKKNNIECVFASYLIRYRVNKEIADPFYVWYNLQSDKWKGFVDNIVGGSAQPGANAKQFADFEFYLPPLHEQKAISGILSSLDDKIDLLHRQNKTLEEMAQTLFRKWFIEDAKEDWEEVSLGDFFPVITGKKNANYATEDGQYPFFTCSQEILKAPSYSFEGHAILLAGNGDFNVKRYKGKFEAYQRTYVLIPNEEKYVGLLYTLIKFFLSEITGAYRGSVVKFITKEMIEDFKFKLPADRNNYMFNKKLQYINELYEKIDYNLLQIRTLEQLRDTLLPKLMSGEVRVKL
ncbi:restriction endonuclease subunit S [Venenivibrio stagnispumantis]|uniref:Type I restriction enzyme, S subunit n=1 Tax=Venenivibrio stagnispumantis TaxID=407998 RepID=A0AA45WIT6_9AQUI|nr:restriction endonuclease subunit S [Venenivibrio stagnispumantis]MCW4572667.1 restriction endonuclease subunit S [Venenivibrio stagnispumantis]SMP01021.1 type I restriction enzyme, S subunit [Venenivibrio stagnispumantis]